MAHAMPPNAIAAPRPRVSVICTFLDRERFLEEAVESVLAQDYQDYELLLIDDGSRDGGTAMARAYAERLPDRVRYLSHPGGINRGISASRNLGLRETGGELVAFLDSDDVWAPGKLARQVAILDAQPDVQMVCGMVNYWSSWAGGEDDYIQTGNVTGGRLVPPDTFLSLYPVGDAPAPSPSEIMIRRSAIDEIGGFNEAFPGYYDDQVLFVKAYLRLTIYSADALWVHYRIHPDSCTSITRDRREYIPRRRQFFEWLHSHVQTPESGATDAMRAAVRHELRLLGMPLLWKLNWRYQRLRRGRRRPVTSLPQTCP